MELVNRVGQLNLEGWLGEFFLLVMSSLRSCFLISKNCSLCWVVTLTTGMCWGKSTSFWCVLGQSVCSWRPSKINLETDGSPGEATSEMTHIWPSNLDRQILRIQVAWRNWTHPWAKSCLYPTKQVISGKRKGHSPQFEDDYEHFSLTIWSSCARKRNGAPEEKEGKGLDSIRSRHMPLISIVSMANKISLQLNSVPGSSGSRKKLREFAVIWDFCSARWQKSCKVSWFCQITCLNLKIFWHYAV